jgi:hypothetical protein
MNDILKNNYNIFLYCLLINFQTFFESHVKKSLKEYFLENFRNKGSLKCNFVTHFLEIRLTLNMLITNKFFSSIWFKLVLGFLDGSLVWRILISLSSRLVSHFSQILYLVSYRRKEQIFLCSLITNTLFSVLCYSSLLSFKVYINL